MRAVWAFAAALLCACSKHEPEDASGGDAKISGMLVLSDSAASTQSMQLELILSDVSADEGSLEVARRSIEAPAHFPAEYALPYHSNAIRGEHRYTVSARLLQDGRPQWVTDTAFPVITQGNPTLVDIRLVKAGENSSHVAADTASVTEGELMNDAEVTHYRAYFQGTQLTRLDELRGAGRASYEFMGARLRRYVGNEAGVRIEMEFDERGKLLSSTRQLRGGTSAATGDEVNNVRNRAALLRSHALAQREIQAHTATKSPSQ